MEDLVLHGQFHLIGKFEAIRAEELDAVVAPGIVRGGDDHAGAEPMGMREKCDCGGRHNAGAFNAGSGSAQAGGKSGGDPGARFARVTAQNDGGVDGLAAQGVGQGQANGVDGGGVERAFTGDGANSISTKELACSGCSYGHRLDSEKRQDPSRPLVQWSVIGGIYFQAYLSGTWKLIFVVPLRVPTLIPVGALHLHAYLDALPVLEVAFTRLVKEPSARRVVSVSPVLSWHADLTTLPSVFS